MICIDLNDLNGLPKEYLNELERHNSILLQYESLEKVLEFESIKKLIQEINGFCKKNLVFGYHYTRADKADILKSGLTCRTGNEIRDNFIQKYGSQFSINELEKIQKAWANYFNNHQQKCRDNFLFFNFTRTGMQNGGAEPLLLNYGGEQIYMPLQELEGISKKIKSLGSPLILKCKLDPNYIKTYYEYPWGRIAISTYHYLIKPNSYRNDQDGFQSIDVKSENIEIIEFENNEYYL